MSAAPKRAWMRIANAAVLERRLEELVLAADDPIGELLLQLADVAAAVDVVGAAELDERIAGRTDLDRSLGRGDLGLGGQFLAGTVSGSVGVSSVVSAAVGVSGSATWRPSRSGSPG